MRLMAIRAAESHEIFLTIGVNVTNDVPYSQINREWHLHVSVKHDCSELIAMQMTDDGQTTLLCSLRIHNQHIIILSSEIPRHSYEIYAWAHNWWAHLRERSNVECSLHRNDVIFFNHFVFVFIFSDAEQSAMNANATDVRVIVPLNLLHRSGTWSSPQNLSSSYNHLARSAYTRFDWCGWRIACGLVVLCCIFAFVWWMSSSSTSLLMEWDRFIGVSTWLCPCPCDCACMARILFSLGLIIIINNNNIDRIRTHIRIRKIQKTVKTKTVWRQTHNEIYIYTISYVYLLFSGAKQCCRCRCHCRHRCCCSSWAQEWLAGTLPAIIIFRRLEIYSIRLLVHSFILYTQSNVCSSRWLHFHTSRCVHTQHTRRIL